MQCDRTVGLRKFVDAGGRRGRIGGINAIRSSEEENIMALTSHKAPEHVRGFVALNSDAFAFLAKCAMSSVPLDPHSVGGDRQKPFFFLHHGSRSSHNRLTPQLSSGDVVAFSIEDLVRCRSSPSRTAMCKRLCC